MTIKIFKILTILSYLFIQINGEHVGGPFGLFLLFGLTQDSWTNISGTILIMTALFILVMTTFKNIFLPDKYLLPIIYIILSIPIVSEFSKIISTDRLTSTYPFQLTAGLFWTLVIISYILIIRQTSTATNTG
jgi:hypothetical protein